MKQFIIQQTGYAQVEVERRFVIEVPDDITEGQVEQGWAEWIESKEADLAEELAWMTDDGTGWIGYEVEGVETNVDDIDPVQAKAQLIINLEDAVKASSDERSAT